MKNKISEQKFDRRGFFTVGAATALAAAPLSHAFSFEMSGSGRDGALNIVDYGADPTGSNDSTAAVQSAINDAAANAKAVFIPSGTYKVGALNIPELGASNYEFTLQGESKRNSIFLQSGPLSYISDTTGVFNFSNLTFQAADTFSGNALVYISRHFTSSFRRLWFVGSDTLKESLIGFQIDHPWGSVYESLGVRKLKYGVLLGAAGGDSTHNLFLNCTFFQNSYAGVLARGMQGGGFIGCSFEGNDGVGAVFMNNDKVSQFFESVLFEGNYLTENGRDVSGDRAWLAEYGTVNFGVDFDEFVNNPDPNTPPEQGTRIYQPQILSNRMVLHGGLKYGLLVKCRTGLQLVNNRIEEGWKASVGIDLYNTSNSRIEGNVKMVGDLDATFSGLPWAGAYFDDFFKTLYVSTSGETDGHGTESSPLKIGLKHAMRMVESGGKIFIEGEWNLPQDFTCRAKTITIQSYGAGATLYDDHSQSSMILPFGSCVRLSGLTLDVRYASAGFLPSWMLAGGELVVDDCTFAQNGSAYRDSQYLISGSGQKGTARLSSISNPVGIRLDGGGGFYQLAGQSVADFDWSEAPSAVMSV